MCQMFRVLWKFPSNSLNHPFFLTILVLACAKASRQPQARSLRPPGRRDRAVQELRCPLPGRWWDLKRWRESRKFSPQLDLFFTITYRVQACTSYPVGQTIFFAMKAVKTVMRPWLVTWLFSSEILWKWKKWCGSPDITKFSASGSTRLTGWQCVWWSWGTNKHSIKIFLWEAWPKFGLFWADPAGGSWSWFEALSWCRFRHRTPHKGNPPPSRHPKHVSFPWNTKQVVFSIEFEVVFFEWILFFRVAVVFLFFYSMVPSHVSQRSQLFSNRVAAPEVPYHRLFQLAAKICGAECIPGFIAQIIPSVYFLWLPQTRLPFQSCIFAKGIPSVWQRFFSVLVK